MKLNFFVRTIVFLSMIIPSVVFSDVMINSSFGTKIIFSDKKNGEHYDPYSWGGLSFQDSKERVDLSIKGRYFTEDGSSKLSPSGKYLVVNSISGGYVEFADGKKEYTDKAHCSVVDMRNGCFISDWDGEACGYDWKKNEDILISSNSPEADTFDFLSLRPTIKSMENNLSSLDGNAVRSYLRCDAPNKENINTYQQLVKINRESKKIIVDYIVNYLNSIDVSVTVKAKTYLFPSPNNNSQAKAYLVPGDKVKVIKTSPDNKWVNIGYINAKGIPLVAWIMSNTLGE